MAAAWVLRPQDFAGEEHATPDAPAEAPWDLACIGWPELRVHPHWLIDEETLAVASLWHRLRAAPHVPPCAGGWPDQPAMLLAAFAVCDGAARALEAAFRREDLR